MSFCLSMEKYAALFCVCANVNCITLYSYKACKSHLITMVAFRGREGTMVGHGKKKDLSKGTSVMFSPLFLSLPSFFFFKKYVHTLLSQLKITFKDLEIILSRKIQLYP